MEESRVESQESRAKKTPPAIYRALADVMREVGAVGHDKKNTDKGYAYRSTEAVYNHIQPLMAKYGIVGVPEVIKEENAERTTRKGSTAYVTKLTVRYTFFAEDGSSVVATVVGEGADFGDSTSAAKAMTIAHRFALCQVFNIPFAQIDPENGKENGFIGKVSAGELNDLKKAWHQANIEANEQLDQEARGAAFKQWVDKITGKNFAVLDHRQWGTESWVRCADALKPKTETTA